jgi:Polyketide cyclase / dehydrase and lipid transport
MAHGFSGSVVIDRPIDEVFAFLADGTNDPKFSPRVQEVRTATDGPWPSAPYSRARSRTRG